MRCPYCERPLHLTSIRCRVCGRYVPRWPHIIVLGTLTVLALMIIIDLLEMLARSRP